MREVAGRRGSRGEKAHERRTEGRGRIVPPPDVERVRRVRETRTGRLACWLLLAAAGAAVAVVKYGGVRDAVAASGPAWLAGVLGWTPSFVPALVLPLAWPALGARFGRAGASTEYLPECLVGAAILFVLEVADGWNPGAVFAWSDVFAIVAGTALSFLAYRTVVAARPRPARPATGAP